MAFEIQVMRKRRIEGEDDDALGMLQGDKLCEPSLSKAIAAVRIFRMLKAESNEEKVTTHHLLC